MGNVIGTSTPSKYAQHLRTLQEKFTETEFVSDASLGDLQILEENSTKRRYAMKMVQVFSIEN